jgi:hypothetical protein
MYAHWFPSLTGCLFLGVSLLWRLFIHDRRRNGWQARTIIVLTGLGLSYVPLPFGSIVVLGIPFPIAFSAERILINGRIWHELSSGGLILGLIAIGANMLFVREVLWLYRHIQISLKSRNQHHRGPR